MHVWVSRGVTPGILFATHVSISKHKTKVCRFPHMANTGVEEDAATHGQRPQPRRGSVIRRRYVNKILGSCEVCRLMPGYTLVPVYPVLQVRHVSMRCVF